MPPKKHQNAKHIIHEIIACQKLIGSANALTDHTLDKQEFQDP